MLPRLQAIGLQTHILGPLDLALECRCTVSLSGPSGSGKSVLLRALADLDPHQGELFVDGVCSLRFRPHVWRRSVGYLPAESHWWSSRVGDHFSSDGNAGAWLQVLGFESDVLRWEVTRLSSGERQRLALIRLLCNDPKVLLLDEPTANLDAANSARVESLLKQWCNETGAALLWVSHDPQQRQRVADRWVCLEDGRVVEESGCT